MSNSDRNRALPTDTKLDKLEPVSTRISARAKIILEVWAKDRKNGKLGPLLTEELEGYANHLYDHTGELPKALQNELKKRLGEK